MKQIIRNLGITTAILLVLGFASCKKESVLNVSKTAITFTSSIRTVSFTVTANEGWNATYPEWLTCTPSDGAGDATIKVTAEDNEGLDRTGSIILTNGSGKSVTIEVLQEGIAFGISQYDFDFDSKGTPIKATILSEHDWAFAKFDEKSSWLEVSPSSGKPGETVVTFTPKPFTERLPRNKTFIQVDYNGTFTMLSIKQAMPNDAPEAPVLLSPEANEGAVKVNVEFRWRRSVDPDGDAVTYKVSASADGGVSWVSTTTENTSAKMANLLDKSTDYVWKVEASDEFGGKSTSETWSFTTGEGGAYADGEVVRWQTESAGATLPVHLVIMGDGFIAEDYVAGGAFDKAVETALGAFFGVEPFPTYRDYFRVSTVAVYSQERGATVLKDMSGCKAQTRNTAFNSTLEGGNSTGTSCDYDKVFQMAKKVPGVTDTELKNTTVLVLINLDVYAGTCLMEMTGRSVSMCPMGKSSFEKVVSHEAGGHGFGRLLDEYRYYASQLPASEKSQIQYWRNADPYYAWNVSLTGDRDQVHWKQYFTTPGYEAVGMYEGADLYEQGIWRPEYNSCMNNNIPYYNAPSREAIVRRIMRASGKSFNMSDFIANDKVKSEKGISSQAYGTPSDFVPFAPPIRVNK
jgi:hypothetical protein